MVVDKNDYAMARQWAKVVQALVEGNEDPSGEVGVVGDGGRAFGILQEHPCFFLQYYGRNGFVADVRDTWPQAMIKAAASFIEQNTLVHSLDLVVQAYNQGYKAVFSDGIRAPEYLARFKAAYVRLGGV